MAHRKLTLIFILGLAGCAHNQIALQTALKIKASDMTSYSAGSDAGGSSWSSKPEDGSPNQGSTEELTARHQLIAELMKLPVWETTEEDGPKGCEKAYYADPSINAYRFPDGMLTIPPSRLYPPGIPGTNTRFFNITWITNYESYQPARTFCARTEDVQTVMKKHATTNLKGEF